METAETKKERKPNQTTLLKKRVENLENIANELKETVRNTNNVDLAPFEEKIERFENVLSGINIDSIKSKLFDLEEKTNRSISGFKQTLHKFKEAFDKFEKVWSHNEEGETVNDHFKGKNVEKPFIQGGVPVDESGSPLEKKIKSKLQESMIGDLPVLNVP